MLWSMNLSALLLALLLGVSPDLSSTAVQDAEPAKQEGPEAAELVQEVPASPDAEEIVSKRDRALATLGVLRDSRQARLDQLQELRDEFDPNTDSELRLTQIEDARRLSLEISQLEREFETIATGIDVRELQAGEESKVDLVAELTQFLQPLISELRQATEDPREIEQLAEQLEAIEQRQLPMIAKALASLGELRTAAEPGSVLELELAATLEEWSTRQRELENQQEVVQFQLEQRLQERGSLFESSSKALGDFFETRGMNLFLALAAGIGILLATRLLHRLARRFFHAKPREERAFYSRLIDVLYFAMSGVAAVLGGLLVLYSTGDWALLGLATLVLLGLIWASKTAVPIFLEQIQLLLNIGPVREHERVIVNDLPWQVSRISIHSILINPRLTGGHLRLPIRDLLGLRSRPSQKDEPWFPTTKGDWVLMDGRPAQVLRQSIENVRVSFLGGSQATLPAVEFMTSGVENLSHGFRISQVFGVDYELQSIVTNRVVDVMEHDLSRELQSVVNADQIKQVRVEFREAGASSLDLALLIDLEGSAAPHYQRLQRAIQRILVDTCTREEWTIPFTQLTLHQA